MRRRRGRCKSQTPSWIASLRWQGRTGLCATAHETPVGYLRRQRKPGVPHAVQHKGPIAQSAIGCPAVMRRRCGTPVSLSARKSSNRGPGCVSCTTALRLCCGSRPGHERDAAVARGRWRRLRGGQVSSVAGMSATSPKRPQPELQAAHRRLGRDNGATVVQIAMRSPQPRSRTRAATAIVRISSSPGRRTCSSARRGRCDR
jgi:hypothetical protein